MRTIRSAYTEFKKTKTPVGASSCTKQSFKQECDINHILSQYQNTGVINHLNTSQLEYLDSSSSDNYHSSINTVLSAKNAFDLLPSSIRKRFNNEPSQLIEFVADPNNYDEAVKLGLATPTPEPDPPDPAPLEPKID